MDIKTEIRKIGKYLGCNEEDLQDCMWNLLSKVDAMDIHSFLHDP